MVTPDKALKLIRLYLERYLSIPDPADMAALLQLADDYDSWFMGEGVGYLQSRLTITAGVWQPMPELPAEFGRLVSDACARIVIDGVSKWLTDDGANRNGQPRISDYWLRGLELWRLNVEMLGKRPPRHLMLTDEEIAQIGEWNETFVDIWQDHLARHLRHMKRLVHTATLEGWTTARFLNAVQAPDGHVVGFRYGNASYSWHEHLRRFGKGKMRMLAQIAQQGRMIAQ